MSPILRRLAVATLLLGAPLLAGCAGDLPRATVDGDEERKDNRNPLDEASINEIMLTVAGADEAVAYFRDALASDPESPSLRRGLARSLAKAGRYAEARVVFRDLVEANQAMPRDHVEYALVLARLDMWPEAEIEAAKVPDDYQSDRRTMLTALMADHREDWAAADAAWERARALSPQPAAVLNNWGVSKMARGEFEQAERLFEQALVYDPSMFSAKNNLAIANGLQRRYRLPVVSLTGEEKAVLLHNLGVIALRQGDREMAESLLQQSLDSHPAYYAPAAEKLSALRGS
ncbi:tetratricopeptide repeat protein [Albimonas sp. CAU 1670]|uniref:tetratricopeptide repeat protein n=1 Tax=Albimonas sp. CAU 1670 TaxID=3032599 RepID=UPI0023DC3B89|nr:tetratricopeptide repeat protein [Albimonas sp. CAU 1670]MDF2234429.1 tetratricopeptide repeat protein [Albimonas sp. CAU 1670]